MALLPPTNIIVKASLAIQREGSFWLYHMKLLSIGCWLSHFNNLEGVLAL